MAISGLPVEGGHALLVEGAHGSGKAAHLVARLRTLCEAGVPAHSVLVLVPQRDRRAAIERRSADGAAGKSQGASGAYTPDFLTYYGLASRAARLFWPAAAAAAGYAHPEQAPVFLTYETSQYLMGQVIAPRLARGFFEGLSMRPQRVLSQLLDNLNKAAVNGYPVEDVARRLRGAWAGEASRAVYFDQAQECAVAFRRRCLERGLVDFSLAVELFDRHLLPRDDFWAYLGRRYRHLIVDQLEETVPVAQDLIRRFLAQCDSACLFLDRRGGYRVFMGIDATGARQVGAACTRYLKLPEPALPAPMALARALDWHLGGRHAAGSDGEASGALGEARRGLAGRIVCRYRADMISGVADEVVRLVESGVPAAQIAVVAPHADGVLRHLLGRALGRARIPFSAARRFAALRDERIVRLGLTLAALAHPQWQARPHPWDVAEALAYLGDLDPVRAALATRQAYDAQRGRLAHVAGPNGAEAERLGPAALTRLDAVRAWLEADGGQEPLDHFLRRLFGEVISRPGLGADQAAAYARLVSSAAWFREAAPALGLDRDEAGQRFLDMVWDGVVAAAPVEDGAPAEPDGGVLLVAPVYTYLLQSRGARYQFWLDVGSMRWWEPPHQPLTNPHVLARSWPEGDRWTDAVDFATRNDTLRRLVHGLCRRCSKGVYACSSEVEEAGEPQDGPLLRALDRVGREA